MFTSSELEIVGEAEAREAINKSVGDLLVANGRINLSYLSDQQIEMVIYMLRQFKAIMR